MNNINKVFVNTSGHTVQNELRISSEFRFRIADEIKVLYRYNANSDPELPGYIVHNINYVGNERCFETSWISEKCLAENFTEYSPMMFVKWCDLDNYDQESLCGYLKCSKNVNDSGYMKIESVNKSDWSIVSNNRTFYNCPNSQVYIQIS